MKKQNSFKTLFTLVAVALLAFSARPAQAAVTLDDLAGTYSFVAASVSENPGSLATEFDVIVSLTENENEVKFSSFVASANSFVGTFDADAQTITVAFGQDLNDNFDILSGEGYTDQGSFAFTVNADGSLSTDAIFGIYAFWGSSVLYTGATLTKTVQVDVPLADVLGTYSLVATDGNYFYMSSFWPMPTNDPKTTARYTDFDFTIAADAASGENALTITGMWGIDAAFKATYNQTDRRIIISAQTVGNWDITGEVYMSVKSATEIIIDDAGFTVNDNTTSEAINIAAATATKEVASSAIDQLAGTYTFVAAGVSENPGSLATEFDVIVSLTDNENEVKFSNFVASANSFVGTYDATSQKITVAFGQDLNDNFDILSGEGYTDQGSFAFTVNADGSLSTDAIFGIYAFWGSSVLYTGATLTKTVQVDVPLADVLGTYSLVATDGNYFYMSSFWPMPTNDPKTTARYTDFDFTIAADAASGENALTITGMWGIDAAFKATYNQTDRRIIISAQTVGNWDITGEVYMSVKSATEIIIDDAGFTVNDNTTSEAINIVAATATKKDAGSAVIEESADNTSALIYAQNGVLYVKAAQTVKVEVYSLSGALMSQGTSDAAITLPRGMYLVKAGNQIQRVIL